MNRVHQMFKAHPHPASGAGDEAFGVVAGAAECAATCTTCADACLAEEDPASLRLCIRLNLDCADVCATASRVLARPGRQDPAALRALLEACAAICRACGDECASHGERMEHCKVCSEACRACERACERMASVVVA